jgi:sugar lactone lactonase YvrE
MVVALRHTGQTELKSKNETRMDQAQKIGGTQTMLGEAPRWSTSESALYWVDCCAATLRRLMPASGVTECWEMPSRVGGLVLSEKGPVVVLQTGVYQFEPDSGSLSLIAPSPDLPPNVVLQEARCDLAGRLWVGAINLDYLSTGGQLGGGALFRLTGNRLVTEPAAGEITVPNGLAWDKSGDTLYFADSAFNQIWAYDYDLARGAISRRRNFHTMDMRNGLIDGAAVDAEDWLLVRLLPWRMRGSSSPGRIPRCGNQYSQRLSHAAGFRGRQPGRDVHHHVCVSHGPGARLGRTDISIASNHRWWDCRNHCSGTNKGPSSWAAHNSRSN